MSWYRFVNGSSDSPTSLARISNMASEMVESGVLEQGTGRKVQEPGTDDTATTPQFSDIWDVQIVLVVLWVAQWCCFGINLLLVFANIGVTQDIQSLGISRHDTVLNTVVNHFDEVTSTVRPTVQIALLSCPSYLLASRRAWRRLNARGQRGENRIETLNNG